MTMREKEEEEEEITAQVKEVTEVTEVAGGTLAMKNEETAQGP